jgi:hypothetical protein
MTRIEKNKTKKKLRTITIVESINIILVVLGMIAMLITRNKANYLFTYIICIFFFLLIAGYILNIYIKQLRDRIDCYKKQLSTLKQLQYFKWALKTIENKDINKTIYIYQNFLKDDLYSVFIKGAIITAQIYSDDKNGIFNLNDIQTNFNILDNGK